MFEPNEIPKCDLCGRRLAEDFEVEIGICEGCCERTDCEAQARDNEINSMRNPGRDSIEFDNEVKS